jgi:hypothetical protein
MKALIGYNTTPAEAVAQTVTAVVVIVAAALTIWQIWTMIPPCSMVSPAQCSLPPAQRHATMFVDPSAHRLVLAIRS